MKIRHTNIDILTSLNSPYNYQQLINLVKQEGGGSNEFIFSTYDEKFVLKTITKTDRKHFLSKMLVKYIDRIKSCPESRLVRILGLFKIKPTNQSFILMENIIHNKQNCIIFDLKGSKMARLVKGIENPEHPPAGCILKDINFLLFNKKIYLNEEIKAEFLKVLKMDFEFLRDCEVTDYSILLAIYAKKVNDQLLGAPLPIDENGTQFTMGIIDIFQDYNFLKAGEKLIKAVFNKKEDISSASPVDYFNRIYEFTESIFQ